VTPELTLGRVVLRAFLASLLATVIGAELIGLYLAVALSVGSHASNSIQLILAMVVGAPFLAAPWVIPSGTLAATLLAPLANRVAPLRTQRALISLVAFGALAGFVLLFVFGFCISLYFDVHYPDTPLSGALMLSRVYGPVFGALTAAGWWWQLPQPAHGFTGAPHA
jgi:hypothetical protein